MDKVKPYYQTIGNFNYNFVVTVNGLRYTFDAMERATDFIQQVLAYSVCEPVISMYINVCEVKNENNI